MLLKPIVDWKIQIGPFIVTTEVSVLSTVQCDSPLWPHRVIRMGERMTIEGNRFGKQIAKCSHSRATPQSISTTFGAVASWHFSQLIDDIHSRMKKTANRLESESECID